MLLNILFLLRSILLDEICRTQFQHRRLHTISPSSLAIRLGSLWNYRQVRDVQKRGAVTEED